MTPFNRFNQALLALILAALAVILFAVSIAGGAWK